MISQINWTPCSSRTVATLLLSIGICFFDDDEIFVCADFIISPEAKKQEKVRSAGSTSDQKGFQ